MTTSVKVHVSSNSNSRGGLTTFFPSHSLFSDKKQRVVASRCWQRAGTWPPCSDCCLLPRRWTPDRFWRCDDQGQGRLRRLWRTHCRRFSLILGTRLMRKEGSAQSTVMPGVHQVRGRQSRRWQGCWCPTWRADALGAVWVGKACRPARVRGPILPPFVSIPICLLASLRWFMIWNLSPQPNKAVSFSKYVFPCFLTDRWNWCAALATSERRLQIYRPSKSV